WLGNCVTRRPLTSYAVQIFSSGSLLRTSSSITAIESTPLSRAVYRTATASNQPQRRGRRVTVPYSLPRSRRCWPISLSCSVGNGPPPTRVEYAFTTPSVDWTAQPGTPVPTESPVPQLDEVTNGKVPWSRSSSTALAPSNSNRLPPRQASCKSLVVLVTKGRN